jgi:hypothetical protein
MNYQKRFLEIIEFLKPYQRIWQNEIMLLYPNPFQDYPREWIQELAGIRNKEDRILLEKKAITHIVQGESLKNFYARVEELCTFPAIAEFPPMPEDHYTFLYTIPKKQHEIRKLAPLVNDFYHKNNLGKIVDIGGGIGLLAQTLTNQYNLRVFSVDMDPKLQETGHQRHQKNARHPENKVEYLNTKVDAHNLVFKNILTPNSLTVGLHTCGALANHQIISSAQAQVKGIINFGCCYNKLVHDPDSQNISQFAQAQPDKFEMNHFALTLASHAHRKMEEKDYDLKMKVKFYRYAIHFLLHDEYGQQDLLTLGNSSPKLYDESFGTYALEQLQRVNITPKHTKEELDAYFDQTERQEFIWEMLSAGVIRNTLGRLLELYLLLDRVIYLEERGYQANLYEFFIEELSPRNLGIVADLPDSVITT